MPSSEMTDQEREDAEDAADVAAGLAILKAIEDGTEEVLSLEEMRVILNAAGDAEGEEAEDLVDAFLMERELATGADKTIGVEATRELLAPYLKGDV